MKVINLATETEQKERTTVNVQAAKQQKTAGLSDNKKENLTGKSGATVEISEEAKQKYAQMQSLLQNMKDMKEQNKEAEEYVKDVGKIMTIFRRIANGDIVPWRDEKKLMEYSSEMYQMAKNAAMLAENDKPKKYKSVDEEEEEQRRGQDTSDTSCIGISGMEDAMYNSGETTEEMPVE